MGDARDGETVQVRMALMSNTFEILDVLRRLTPFDTDSLRKLRIGREADGGYVMLDDLDEINLVYSFGIGNSISFDDHLARSGKQILMFDHTVDGPPFQNEKFHFFKQGLAGADDDAANVFTMQHYLERFGHLGRLDMAAKIDVEGAELDALGNTPAHVLQHFRQIVLELHWLQNLEDEGFRSKLIHVLDKMNSMFTLCHVHGNNCAPVSLIGGLPVAWVLELTYVRSDLITCKPSTTVYPTDVDYPNDERLPDLLLWFYPFLPVREGVGIPDLRASLQAAQRGACERLTGKQPLSGM